MNGTGLEMRMRVMQAKTPFALGSSVGDPKDLAKIVQGQGTFQETLLRRELLSAPPPSQIDRFISALK